MIVEMQTARKRLLKLFDVPNGTSTCSRLSNSAESRKDILMVLGNKPDPLYVYVLHICIYLT